MKRSLSRVLALILILAMFLPLACSSASAATTRKFSYVGQSPYYMDLWPDDPCFDAANYLYDRGIMNGTDKFTFSPDTYVTRGQLVTILWRCLGKPPVDKTVAFKDCKASHWAYDAVQWAQSTGIATGYTDGTFRPNKTLTNQELYVFLHRFVKYCGYKLEMDADYRDVFRTRVTKRSTYQTYAYAAAGWIYKEKLQDNSKHAGTALCTRGDTAILIYNILQKYQKKYALSLVIDNVVSGSNTTVDAYLGRMNAFFEYLGAQAIGEGHVTFYKRQLIDNQITFSDAMTNAFGKAGKLDTCYLSLHAHGSPLGMQLFEDGAILSPETLRKTIEKYNGTFVVMIDTCYAGTYISQEDGKDLRGSHRIKVLCSSTDSQVSLFWYRGLGSFTASLGHGFGYDIKEGTATSNVPADTQGYHNGLLTMKELYNYSMEWLDYYGYTNTQTPVCYPMNDDTVIFEPSY